MTEIIDAFAHVLPAKFYERVREVHPTDELLIYEDKRHLWDTAIDGRLADMDEYGIDRQVLTLLQPTFWRGIDRTVALDLVRVANDEVRRIADEHPDRFIPVATVPFLDGEFLDEVDRCVDDLGMAGVQTFTNIDGKPLDSPEFREFYAKVADEDVPLWLHPQLHEWYDWTEDYMLHKLFGWPFDTTLALARLVFGGVVERHPSLSVIAHHMGGMVPHLDRRIESFAEMVETQYPYRAPSLSEPAVEYFRRFYGDTALYGSPSSLESGYDFFGADHLVFAIDYPLGPERGRRWIGDTLEAIDAMDVTPQEREAVLGGNVASMLDL